MPLGGNEDAGKILAMEEKGRRKSEWRGFEGALVEWKRM